MSDIVIEEYVPIWTHEDDCEFGCEGGVLKVSEPMSVDLLLERLKSKTPSTFPNRIGCPIHGVDDGE